MSYYGGFPPYIPVAERREKAKQVIEKLKKKNPNILPVIIEGRKLALTWWGKAWNDNLESYADYSNRIGRGRSYVRNMAVIDLQITAGNINALVQGSSSKPYEVNILIEPLSEKILQRLTKECTGKIETLEELIEGKFPKALSEMFTAKGKGLFPSTKEIRLNCSCPDGAVMCKHIAAVLYGVGARLDKEPQLFFVLRNIEIDKFILALIGKKSEEMLKKSTKKGRRVIEDENVFDIFGIE